MRSNDNYRRAILAWEMGKSTAPPARYHHRCEECHNRLNEPVHKLTDALQAEWENFLGVTEPARWTLSIKQPWADLILYRHKLIENRSWSAPQHLIGKRVLIHAGLRVDLSAVSMAQWVQDHLLDTPQMLHDIDRAYNKDRRGAILGEVTLARCVRQHESPWFFGPYGFVMKDPKAYPEPIECRGKLGFFKVAIGENNA